MNKFKETTATFNELTAKEEAKRCLNCPRPLCKEKGCPANLDINEIISFFNAGDIDGAYRVIRRGSTLPLICSRVCDFAKQCEGNCILNLRHRGIPVGQLERYICSVANMHETCCITNSSKRVAVLGSGPSGLACAATLAREGIKVTVFEKEPHLGGQLSHGIPEYRLPLSVLEKQIEHIKELGVEFVVNSTKTKEELLKEGFSAVFLGYGLNAYLRLNIIGEELEGLYNAGEFLKTGNYLTKYNEGEKMKLGGTVVVIGAGNVAMDCARLSLRLGAKKVKIVYRRSKNEVPCSKAELREAEDEGVEFLFLSNPTKILGSSNVTGIEVEEMILGPEDESKRQRPLGTGIYKTIYCDYVIEAIGQIPSLIKVDEDYRVDDLIYAGGDVIRGAKTVVQAMYDGQNAAKAIIKHLF